MQSGILIGTKTMFQSLRFTRSFKNRTIANNVICLTLPTSILTSLRYFLRSCHQSQSSTMYFAITEKVFLPWNVSELIAAKVLWFLFWSFSLTFLLNLSIYLVFIWQVEKNWVHGAVTFGYSTIVNRLLEFRWQKVWNCESRKSSRRVLFDKLESVAEWSKVL